jgi:hypothetical protein
MAPTSMLKGIIIHVLEAMKSFKESAKHSTVSRPANGVLTTEESNEGVQEVREAGRVINGCILAFL